MTELIKKEWNFTFIPPELEKEFIKSVFSAYFDCNRLDLHNIGYLTEEFSVYAHSLEKTGDPYLIADDPKKTDKDFKEITDIHFNELIADIFEVMKHYNLFHAWNDIGNDDKYVLLCPAIIPVRTVW